MSLAAGRAHTRRPNQVAINVLNIKVGQTRAHEVILVKDSDMLDKVLKLRQKAVLDEFSLQEAPFVDGAVEEALETDVPEEVVAVFLCEEVLGKLVREVGELLSKHGQSACLGVLLDLGCQSAVEESKVVVVLLQ